MNDKNRLITLMELIHGFGIITHSFTNWHFAINGMDISLEKIAYLEKY